MSHQIYKMSTLPSADMTFNLLYVTHSEYDKGWHSTLHSHHFTELFYIVKGKGAFILPHQEIPVKENDLVIINPNIEHTERSNETDSLEYIALGIEGISFSLPESEESLIGLYTYRGEREEILFYLNTLLHEIQQNEDEFEVISRNIIEILVVKLRRAKNLNVEHSDSKNLNQAVALVKHYINHNYREPLDLDTLAAAGSINKYYLAHTFKEEIGAAPMEYLTQTRIREAQIHLEATDYTIGEVARFNGFSSQSFFTQAFRRITGETPSHYRRKHAK